MYYIEDNYGKTRGPFSPADLSNFLSKGYIQQDTEFFDENGHNYSLASIIKSAQIPLSNLSYEQSDLNITVADVTLEMNGNLKVNQSTICESPDFTQLTGYDDTCIPEEPEVSLLDLRHLAEYYIDRRPIFNQSRRFIDTYLPFELSWADWVPFFLTKSAALNHALKLKQHVLSLNRRKLTSFLKSIYVPIRNCSLCHAQYQNEVIIIHTQSQLLLHSLSPEHLQMIYSQPGHGISLIDVFCVEKIIKEVMKMDRENVENTDASIHLEKKQFFLDSCNSEMAFSSLKNGLMLCPKYPLLTVPQGNSDVTCEYVEALVLLRQLAEKLSKLSPKYLQQSTGCSLVKCEVCDELVTISTLQNFQQHILYEKHILSAIEKGVSRNDVETWLSFCRAMTSRRNRNLKSSESDPTESLQDLKFPFCVMIDDCSDELKFCKDEKEYVIKYIRGLLKSKYSVFGDREFSTYCGWCDVQIGSKSHALKHILYDKNHLEKLNVISNEDVRMLFNLLQIQVTVPLFQKPRKNCPINNEHREKLYVSKLRSFLKNSKDNSVFCHESSFPLSLVNHCEICNVELADTEDILPHLITNGHWNNMNQKYQLMEEDFDFWWNILCIS